MRTVIRKNSTKSKSAQTVNSVTRLHTVSRKLIYPAAAATKTSLNLPLNLLISWSQYLQ